MTMFNYIFPIFCFGLLITGVVFLGILEAAEQVKAEALRERERDTPPEQATLARSQNGHETRLFVRSIND